MLGCKCSVVVRKDWGFKGSRKRDSGQIVLASEIYAFDLVEKSDDGSLGKSNLNAI